MKIFEKIKFNNEREVRLFDIPILKYSYFCNDNIKEKYLDILPSKGFREEILDELSKKTGNYKHVYLLRCGMGELYLFMFLLKEVIERYGEDNVCLVYLRNQWKDLINLYHPNVKHFSINQNYSQWNNVFNKAFYKRNGQNFYIYHCTRSQIVNIWKKYAKDYNIAYPNLILNLTSEKSYNYKQPVFPEYFPEKLMKKVVKETSLNIDNFIFLTPEAISVQELPIEFWTSLADKLIQKGFDLYVNALNSKYKYIGKNCDLSIAEAMYLASRSKSVIGIRSGFLETISTYDIPKHIIYTDLKSPIVPSSKVKVACSFLNYPNVNKNSLFEYITSLQNTDIILKKIIERF